MDFVVREKKPINFDGLVERAEAEKAEREKENAEAWKKWAEDHTDTRTAGTLASLASNQLNAREQMNIEIKEAEDNYRHQVDAIKARYRARFGTHDWNKDEELIWKEFASKVQKR